MLWLLEVSSGVLASGEKEENGMWGLMLISGETAQDYRGMTVFQGLSTFGSLNADLNEEMSSCT